MPAPSHTIRNTECHRGIIRPIAWRSFEERASHHFSDVRVLVFAGKLDWGTETIPDDQPPEHAAEPTEKVRRIYGKMLIVVHDSFFCWNAEFNFRPRDFFPVFPDELSDFFFGFETDFPSVFHNRPIAFDFFSRLSRI